jgi:hypothetical protein
MSTVEHAAGELDDFLQPLDPERRAAIKAWMAEKLNDCPVCEKPVLVGDPHRAIKKGIAHRACADATEPPEPPARTPGLTPRAS